MLVGVTGFVTLVAAGQRLLRRRNAVQQLPPRAEVPFLLWGMVLFFVFWTCLSYLFSETRNYGLDEVLQTTSISLLFLWTIRRADEQGLSQYFRRIVRVILWSAIVACLVGMVVYVSQPVNRFVGTFFDYRFHTDYWPNAWADFLLLVWPLALYEVIQRRGSWKGWLACTVLGMLFGSLLLSFSRGAMLAVILQIVILLAPALFLHLRDIRYRRIARSELRQMLVQGLIMLCIAAAMFLSLNAMRSRMYDIQSVAAKVTFTSSEGTSSIDERAQFWRQALALSTEHPMLGWGPYSFRFVQPRLAEGVLATSDHPHNVLLKIAMERGWAGLLIVLACAAYVLSMSLRTLFLDRRFDWSQERDLRTLLLLAAVTGVVAHSMIDYNLQFAGIAVPFWLCLGLLVAPLLAEEHMPSTSFTRWKTARNFLRLEVLTACVMLIVAVWEGRFLVLSSLGRHAQADGKTNEALEWYQSARREWLSRDMYLSESQLFLEKGQLQNARDSLERYLAENAQDPRAWKLKGIVEMRSGKRQQAMISLEHALELGAFTDPGITRLLLEYADTGSGDLTMRKQEFDMLFSAYATAIEQNTHFIALSDAPEEVLAMSRSLAKLFPTDAQRYKLIARSAYRHAAEERMRFAARKPGMLW